ncbi:MAG: hypothetical protein DRQ55_17375 [Planctomycetota bacterium]|nr:MAG: hypothetical protein DRQ55_17375 [Planctomycetota bacterium]
MPLAQGSTLLHYEILAPLGVGAMGEVWRARDPRLGREVAVKVLPSRFAHDKERLLRFEREARAVASLNHSCVAQIHDVGQEDELCFIVLEFVPGETLEDRIGRGPLPLDEALAVCARIADGLEAAHDVGIIHRDLKPANVRITPDGQVKLLDFGLARSAHDGEGSTTGSDSVLATADGSVLGTPTYMAPEQARARPIDRRVDVWAFGCVLFECLTGRRAFPGRSLSEVLAAVLEHEPNWSLLPALPQPVETLLRRCLIKDPRLRLRDVGEARLLFDDPDGAALGAGGTATRTDAAPHVLRARTWLAITSVALVATLLALAWQQTAGGAAGIPGPMHLSIDAPDGARILFGGDLSGPPTVSPDGSTVAFVAVRDDGLRRLWTRRLDELQARELLGTDNATFPFWSPDGRELGYFADNSLRRYDLSTDTVSRITETGQARGGAFTGDGRILYTPNFRSGLFLVDADGSGAPVELTIRDPNMHTSHRWPAMIAGTDRFVFSAVTAAVGENDHNGLYLGSLDGSEPPRRVVSSHYSGQVIDGMLLHVKNSSLLATPIDLDTGTLGGRASTLAKGLAPDASTWHGQFSASPTGVLVLSRLPSTTNDPGTKSYDRAAGDRVSYWSYDGRPVTTYAEGTPMFGVSLRPDGQMLATAVLSADGFTDIWLYAARLLSGQDPDDIEAGRLHAPAPQRLTFLPGAEYVPVWSPDGTEVAFFWDGDDDRPRGIYRKRIGDGSETLVRDNQGGFEHPYSWTPDGRFLIVTTDTRLISDENDVIAVPLDVGPDVPLVIAPGPQLHGQVSPDGRWLAYGDLSDGALVFVIAFAPAWPGSPPEGRWLVSENGGYEPRWSPSGDELFYVTDTGVLIAVDVETGGESFSFSSPEALFQTPWNLDRNYEPIPDHQGDTVGFAFLDSDVAAQGPISVILGWHELLGER